MAKDKEGRVRNCTVRVCRNLQIFHHNVGRLWQGLIERLGNGHVPQRGRGFQAAGHRNARLAARGNAS
jgi:hypothetical protein